MMRTVATAESQRDPPPGATLRLSVGRFDERQRRGRVVLPKSASCWDYAPLIDLVVHEAGVEGCRFLGQTVAQRVALLERRGDPALAHFKAWYERIVAPHLPVLERRRRIPDNQYCVEVAPLPLESSIHAALKAGGPNRATAAQWRATLMALSEKGVTHEELALSGVLSRLAQRGDDARLSRTDVLRLVDLSHAMPRLVTESRYGFAARAGWRECCDRWPGKGHRRRRLHGIDHGMVHIRYRHRSLGWAIARSRFIDLFVDRRDWWVVLDEKGRHVAANQGAFAAADDAIAFAELEIGRRFATWGKDQSTAKWERFSLPGGDDYRELLLQLDDWPENYQPRHYRTRNVLAHVRTSLRLTADGRRILFLDEVQSDWHADLHAQADPSPGKATAPAVAQAPLSKEWPMLALKTMLWWAQRCGAEGLAWSSAELQEQRWRGYGPPVLLYRTILPKAGERLAKALSLRCETTSLRVRSASRSVELGTGGWEVRGSDGHPIARAFRERRQAEAFADMTGRFAFLDVPVIWLGGAVDLNRLPLFGVGSVARWTGAGDGATKPMARGAVHPSRASMTAAAQPGHGANA